MVVLIALGLIGAGLFLLYITAQVPDAHPQSGLRGVASILITLEGLIRGIATILIIFGGLVIIGSLVQAGIL